MKVPGIICKNCFSYIGKTHACCPVCGYSGGSDADSSVLPRGTKLGGRYILGGIIGRGGFGITYLAVDGEDGKVINTELSESRWASWPTYESQGIPKCAFYEFDGDVKVTVKIESIDGMEDNYRVVYLRNSGYCINVFDDDILVPLIMDSGGKKLAAYGNSGGVNLDKSCTEYVFVIPKHVKEKMSNGIFSQCMNMRVKEAHLEAYNGEYAAFLEGGKL